MAEVSGNYLHHTNNIIVLLNFESLSSLHNQRKPRKLGNTYCVSLFVFHYSWFQTHSHTDRRSMMSNASAMHRIWLITIDREKWY